MRPFIEADSLCKRYDGDDNGPLALDHVSFEVYPGELYAMLGANGAGKSTTLNLLLDFIQPTSGEARIDGFVVHERPLETKRRVAYVSENVALYPHFTAVQNVDFFARLAGREPTRDELEQALDRVGLERPAHGRKLGGFSKGMRQKTALAIALLKDAPAILLDEPSSGLDPKAGRELTRLLGELRDEGRSILMSTHDVFRAKQLADRVGILRSGRLVAERDRESLRHVDLESLYVRAMEGDLDDDTGVSEGSGTADSTKPDSTKPEAAEAPEVEAAAC